MDNNWSVKVGVQVGDTQAEIQKQLDKIAKNLAVNPSVAIDFTKSKSEVTKSTKEIATLIQNQFNSVAKDLQLPALTDKEALNYAKQYVGVIQQQQKAQQNLVDVMAKGREASEQAYQAEKKRQDLAQNNAMNKALDKEYADQQKLVNQMADFREKSQQVYQTEQKRQELAQSNASNKALEQEYQQIQKINKALNENKVSSDMTSVTSKYSNLASTPSSLVSDYKYLQSLSDKLNTSLDDPTKIEVWNEYKTTLASVNNQMDKVLATSGRLATESQKTTTLASLKNYLSKNSGIDDASKSKINGWIKELTSGMDVAESRTKDMTSSLKLLDAEQREAGKVGLSFTDSIKEQAKTFTQWITVSGIVMSAVQTFRSMIQTVSELDKSLVDLQMATGDSHDQAQNLLNSYIKLGQQLGATGTEVADSAGAWLRQGQSLSDTNTLIKDSMILSKVGQIDSADATKYLTSAMKGYQMQASDVLSINDKLAAVDLNSATDSAGLAEAMSRVANMANLAGVSMDKLLSYLATVGEVTQKDMSSIGESFQTMFSRMGNIKLGKMTDDNGESLNDTEGVLKNLGISLRDSKNSFRDFSDVLDDIGKRWTSLSQVEQNALGVAIAGKRMSCA